MLNGIIMASIEFYFEKVLAGCGVNRCICLDLEGSASHPSAHSDFSSLHGGAALPLLLLLSTHSPPSSLH